MHSAVRSLVAAFAILAVLLTAGVVGAARGQAMAAGEIVICAGGAAVTISVDADGKPTGPPHWCPDCVLTLMAGLADVPADPVPPAGAADPLRDQPAQVHADRHLLPPAARGPPLA